MGFPPSWKDLNAYPQAKRPLDLIAWEFLRRNPLYQKDFRALERLMRVLRRDYPEASTDPKVWLKLQYDPRASVYDPPKLSNETDEAWSRRTRRHRRSNIFESLGKRWGFLNYPPNPKDDRPWLSWPASPTMTRIVFAPIPGSTSEYLTFDTGKVALGFDLAEPLEPQMAWANDFLKAQRAELRKKGKLRPTPRRPRPNRGARLSLLLRVLDAEAAGASIAEIGRVLFPNVANLYPDRHRDRRVRNTLKAAHRMRDGGYRDLLDFRAPEHYRGLLDGDN